MNMKAMIPKTSEGTTKLYQATVVIILGLMFNVMLDLKEEKGRNNEKLLSIENIIKEDRRIILDHITNHPKDIVLPIVPNVHTPSRNPRIKNTRGE